LYRWNILPLALLLPDALGGKWDEACTALDALGEHASQLGESGALTGALAEAVMVYLAKAPSFAAKMWKTQRAAATFAGVLARATPAGQFRFVWEARQCERW